ncbi:DUF2207 family protein [Nocardioides limicola]|uniref:DUF2207 family protein n=1 Tax=Nocardioides limicola TaxID=2803368 RepID=UPI00193AFB7F|nr:DUF2207 domain-containing protein [Nocardioides sp. DJM-14]
MHGSRNSHGRVALGMLVGYAVTLTVLGVLLLAIPLGIALVPSDDTPRHDPAQIRSLSAQFHLSDTGELRAHETLAVDLPGGRRGIFWWWDVTDTTDPQVRHRPKLDSVRRNGNKEQVKLSWEKGRQFRVARIGDPERTLPSGVHTYTVQWHTEGVIGPADRGDLRFATEVPGTDDPVRSSFYWQVVPGGDDMATDATAVTLHLPAASGTVRCSVGFGEGTPCQVTGAGTDRVEISTGPRPPRTPVTVMIDLPIEQPSRTTVAWPVTWDGVLGADQQVASVLVGLGLLGLLVGVSFTMFSRESSPGAPISYAPPQGLGPVQTYYVMHERMPANAVLASLMHLAELGYVNLRLNPDDTWTVTRLPEAERTGKADPISLEVFESLLKSGQSFSVRGVKSGERLQKLDTGLPIDVRRWGSSSGLVVGHGGEQTWRMLWVLALVGAVVAGIVGLIVESTVWAVPFVGFVLGGLPLLRPGVGTRRSEEGRRVWAEAAGFRRLLTTQSAEDRFDFAAREETYLAYLPYAVAFGAAAAWARKYKQLTGQDPPSPAYLIDQRPASRRGRTVGLPIDTVVASFRSSVRSSIGAYSAAQAAARAASSGSSSGGGFSGGGGGGGGGGGRGSW